MTREEIRKLLGGYATGTLTEAERRALFQAALEDQEIFDALADEEALRELLSDEGYRRELAAALAEERPGWRERLAAWWRRPLPVAAALAAVAGVLAVGITMLTRPPAYEVAMRTEPEPVAPRAMKQAGGEAPAPESVEPSGAAAGEPVRQPVKPREFAPERTEAEPAAMEEKAQMAARAKAKAPPKGRPAAPALPLAPRRDVVRTGAAPASGTARRAMIAEARRAPGVIGGVIPERGAAMEGAAGVAAPPTLVARPAGGGRPRVTVERRRADGEFEAAPAGYRFGLGETVRLRVVAPVSGFLYVARQAGESGWRLIHSGRVEAEEPVLVPAGGGLPPQPEPGVRRYRVIVSEEALPLDELESGEAFEPGAAEYWAEVTVEYRAAGE